MAAQTQSAETLSSALSTATPGQPATFRYNNRAITELRAERGAPLAGTIDLRVPAPPGAWRVRGTFRTFVRDLDDLPARCAGDRMPPP